MLSELSVRESVEGHYVPNAGFLEDVVFEDPAFAALVHVSDECHATSDAPCEQQNEVESKEIGESADTNDVISEPHSSLIAEVDSKNDIIEQVTEDASNLKLTENAVADESTTEEQYTLSTADVDAYLDKCLLQALHTTVKDKDLPMPGSTLW